MKATSRETPAGGTVEMGEEDKQEAPGAAGRLLQKLVYFAAWFTVRVWARLYFRVSTRGRIPTRDQGPLLLAANHCSNLDPPLIGALIPYQIHYVAKKELFAGPVWEWLFGKLNMISIDRGATDLKALKRSIKILQDGRQLTLFPEGTRSKDGTLGRGQPGAGMIAAQGRARVVPIYVDGASRAFPPDARWPRPTKVRITFGEPFDLPPRQENEATKAYYQRCADEMMRRIAELRDGALEGGAGTHTIAPLEGSSQ